MNCNAEEFNPYYCDFCPNFDRCRVEAEEAEFRLLDNLRERKEEICNEKKRRTKGENE